MELVQTESGFKYKMYPEIGRISFKKSNIPQIIFRLMTHSNDNILDILDSAKCIHKNNFILLKSFLNIVSRTFTLTFVACVIFLLECWILLFPKITM